MKKITPALNSPVENRQRCINTFETIRSLKELEQKAVEVSLTGGVRDQ